MKSNLADIIKPSIVPVAKTQPKSRPTIVVNDTTLNTEVDSGPDIQNMNVSISSVEEFISESSNHLNSQFPTSQLT